jgi:hypothetical protein
MRYLFGFMCVLALGVMGCGETAGTGGSAGDAGTGGEGGMAGDGGTGVACADNVCPCTEAGIRAAIAEGGGPFTFECDGPTTVVTEAAAAYMGPATIEYKQAAELLFTAEFFGADKALEYGIATRVYPDDELLPQALEKAREMAQWPIDSLVEIKRMMKAMHGDRVALARKLEMEGFGKLMGSDANMEAFSAFMERRPPDFKQFRK